VTGGARSQVDLFVILDLCIGKGLSVSAIARLFDLDRETVRKYIERGPGAAGIRIACTTTDEDLITCRRR
jgi:DNA invertase Pin-like site-specific DNA recombinase